MKGIEATSLEAAVAAVYDAHGTPPGHRVVVDGQLHRAKIVADTHAYHNGDWALGSCDAELFALEWEIFLAELPDPIAPSRGCAWGLVISACLWVAILTVGAAIVTLVLE